MFLPIDSAILTPGIFHTKEIIPQKHKALSTNIYIPARHSISSNLKKKKKRYVIYTLFHTQKINPTYIWGDIFK